MSNEDETAQRIEALAKIRELSYYNLETIVKAGYELGFLHASEHPVLVAHQENHGHLEIVRLAYTLAMCFESAHVNTEWGGPDTDFVVMFDEFIDKSLATFGADEYNIHMSDYMAQPDAPGWKFFSMCTPFEECQSKGLEGTESL